jgi:glycosyltransferase involved in cell wall biosynthesis
MSRLLVFAAYFYPHVGGYEKNILELLRRLVDCGYEIDVVTCNTEKTLAEESMDGIHVYRLPAWNSLGGVYPAPKPAPTTFKILWKLSRKRFDLINTQTRFFVTSLIGLIFAMIKRVPLVHTERGTRHSVTSGRLVETIGKIYDHSVGTLMVKFAWKSIGVSQAACDFTKHLGARNPIVIHNGLDTDIFRKVDSKLKQQMGLGDATVITFVGRLIYAKGVQDLISAFVQVKELVPNAKLFIVGDGPYRKYLEILAQQSHFPDDVIFMGEKNQDDIVAILSATDIFVNPSYSEGLPTSVMEAASVGVPVIATDVGGTKEIVECGTTGLMVEPYRPQQIATAILSLVRDSQMSSEIARAARCYIQQKFDWDEITQRWIHCVCTGLGITSGKKK